MGGGGGGGLERGEERRRARGESGRWWCPAKATPRWRGGIFWGDFSFPSARRWWVVRVPRARTDRTRRARGGADRVREGGSSERQQVDIGQEEAAEASEVSLSPLFKWPFFLFRARIHGFSCLNAADTVYRACSFHRLTPVKVNPVHAPSSFFWHIVYILYSRESAVSFRFQASTEVRRAYSVD
jgi:hypothetical protein